MKVKVFALLVVLSTVFTAAFSQTTTQYIGGPNTLLYSRGPFKVDSLLTGKRGTLDTLLLKRLNLTDRMTGRLTGQSWLHMPFQTNSNTANVGLHISNLPLWDSRLGVFTNPASTYNALNPAPTIGVNRNQGAGSPLSIYRYLFESAGDTNRIDYSQAIQLLHRYTFSAEHTTLDSANKAFYFHTPGYNSNSQYFTQGKNVRAAIGQFGHSGANYTATLGVFDSVGTITLFQDTFYAYRPVPLANYVSDIDMNREGASTEKKIFRGSVGIAGFFTQWKQHQNVLGLPVKGVGNYTDRITDFYSGGPTEPRLWSIYPTWTKDEILAYSTVKYAIGIFLGEKRTPYNEVKYGGGILQEGRDDFNYMHGKTFIGNTNRMYDANFPPMTKEIADTTSARLIVEGKAYIDSVQIDNIRGTGKRALSVDEFGNLFSQAKSLVTLVDAATVLWDINESLDAEVLLQGNRTLSITNVTAGTYGTIAVTQDGTGSRTLTLPAGSKVQGGSLTLTTTPGATDLLGFYYNGSTFFFNIGKNYQ